MPPRESMQRRPLTFEKLEDINLMSADPLWELSDEIAPTTELVSTGVNANDLQGTSVLGIASTIAERGRAGLVTGYRSDPDRWDFEYDTFGDARLVFLGHGTGAEIRSTRTFAPGVSFDAKLVYKDDEDLVELYIDGVLDASAAATGSLTSGAIVHIGGRGPESGGGNESNNSIGVAALWANVTAAELAEILNPPEERERVREDSERVAELRTWRSDIDDASIEKHGKNVLEHLAAEVERLTAEIAGIDAEIENGNGSESGPEPIFTLPTESAALPGPIGTGINASELTGITVFRMRLHLMENTRTSIVSAYASNPNRWGMEFNTYGDGKLVFMENESGIEIRSTRAYGIGDTVSVDLVHNAVDHTVQFYIDGILDAEASIQKTMQSNVEVLYKGRNDGAFANNHEVTNAHIYTALSSAELQSLLFPNPGNNGEGADRRELSTIIERAIQNADAMRATESIDVDLNKNALVIRGTLVIDGGNTASMSIGTESGETLLTFDLLSTGSLAIRDGVRREQAQQSAPIALGTPIPFTMTLRNNSATLSANGVEVILERPLQDIARTLTFEADNARWNILVEREGKTLGEIKAALEAKRAAILRAYESVRSFDRAIDAYAYDAHPLNTDTVERVAALAWTLRLQFEVDLKRPELADNESPEGMLEVLYAETKAIADVLGQIDALDVTLPDPDEYTALPEFDGAVAAMLERVEEQAGTWLQGSDDVLAVAAERTEALITEMMDLLMEDDSSSSVDDGTGAQATLPLPATIGGSMDLHSWQGKSTQSPLLEATTINESGSAEQSQSRAAALLAALNLPAPLWSMEQAGLTEPTRDYIDTGIDTNALSGMTILSAHVEIESRGRGTIFSGYHAGNAHRWDIEYDYDETSARISFIEHQSGMVISTNRAFQAGEECDLLFLYDDAGNTATLFVDGIREATSVATQSLQSASPLRLNGRANDATDSMVGRTTLSDVAVHSGLDPAVMHDRIAAFENGDDGAEEGTPAIRTRGSVTTIGLDSISPVRGVSFVVTPEGTDLGSTVSYYRKNELLGSEEVAANGTASWSDALGITSVVIAHPVLSQQGGEDQTAAILLSQIALTADENGTPLAAPAPHPKELSILSSLHAPTFPSPGVPPQNDVRNNLRAQTDPTKYTKILALDAQLSEFRSSTLFFVDAEGIYQEVPPSLYTWVSGAVILHPGAPRYVHFDAVQSPQSSAFPFPIGGYADTIDSLLPEDMAVLYANVVALRPNGEEGFMAPHAMTGETNARGGGVNAVVDIRNVGGREGHCTIDVYLGGVLQKSFSTMEHLGRKLNGGEQIYLAVNVSGNAGDRFDVVMTSDEGVVTRGIIDTIAFNKEKGAGNPISSSEARRITRIASKAEQAAVTRLAQGTRGRLTASQNNLIAFGGIVEKTERLIALINGEDQETLVADDGTPVEDMVLAAASLKRGEYERLSLEVESMRSALGFKGHETRLYLSGSFQGDLQAESLADWYRDLPLAGRKAFLSVWRGGEYGEGEQSTGNLKIGHYLLEHTGEEQAVEVARAYAQDPAGTVDVLEASYLWSTETEDMTAVALEVDSVLLTEGNGTVIDVQEGSNLPQLAKLQWNIDVAQGEYSLDLYGMQQWGSKNATVYINGQYATSLNMWGNSTNIIVFTNTGNYTIEIKGLEAPKNSHAGSGVISLNRIFDSSAGNHFGESTSKNSFTAGVRRALPGEDLEEKVSFGTREEVVRDLVSLERFGGGEIEGNQESWLVIHGRESYASAAGAIKNTGNENNMYRLAEALQEFAIRNDQQVLVADWRSFAGANIPITPIDAITDEIWDINFGLQGANYIQYVALALHEKLQGLHGNNINIAAHSWGTLVGHDLAGYVMAYTGQKVNSFISLDTAGNNKFPLGSNYPINSVDFRNVAETSWAFEGSAFGSNERSARADMTMWFTHPFAINPVVQHGLVVETFARLVRDAVDDADDKVSKNFNLNKLIDGDKDFPWVNDAFGAYLTYPDKYEGHISTFDTGEEHADNTPIYDFRSIHYVPKSGDDSGIHYSS